MQKMQEGSQKIDSFIRNQLYGQAFYRCDRGDRSFSNFWVTPKFISVLAGKFKLFESVSSHASIHLRRQRLGITQLCIVVFADSEYSALLFDQTAHVIFDLASCLPNKKWFNKRVTTNKLRIVRWRYELHENDYLNFEKVLEQMLTISSRENLMNSEKYSSYCYENSNKIALGPCVCEIIRRSLRCRHYLKKSLRDQLCT